MPLSLCASTNYIEKGIIAGMADLLEHEGTETVIAGLDEIFPFEAYRPTILFYDNACKLRRWRILHPVVSWMGTRYIVDRQVIVTLRVADITPRCLSYSTLALPRTITLFSSNLLSLLDAVGLDVCTEMLSP